MSAGQDPNSLMLITLAIMATVVIFWRTVIKLVAIGTLALVVLGFLEVLQALH